VVASNDGKPLVIKDVTDGKVIFNDNTYVINGGSTCYGLNFLADSVQDYDGERVNG
jgi:hypothetical protein